MRLILLTLTLLTTFLAACEAPAPTAVNPASLSAVDPCALRLHDISGALLMYYTLNKQLPDSLDQLRPLADDGTMLQFTCPLSNQPYTYLPVNPDVPVSEPCLILFDSTPAHNNLRWGIVAIPAKDKQPVSFEVIQLDNKSLRAYHINPK